MVPAIRASFVVEAVASTDGSGQKYLGVLQFPRHSNFKTILSIDGGGLRGFIPGENPGLKFSHLLMHLSMSKSGRGPPSKAATHRRGDTVRIL